MPHRPEVNRIRCGKLLLMNSHIIHPMPKRDVNEAAADTIRHTLAAHELPLPADVEAAWEGWIASIDLTKGNRAHFFGCLLLSGV